MTNERSTGADSSEVTNQNSIGQQDMVDADGGTALQGEVIVADLNDAPNPLTGTLDVTQTEAQTSQLSRLPEQDAFTALLALSEHVSSRFPLSTPPHSTDDQQPVTDDLHTAIAAEEEPSEAPTLLQMNEPQVLEPISVSPSGCERSQKSSDSTKSDKGLEMPMVPEFCERRQIGYEIVRSHPPAGGVPESDSFVANSEDEHEDHGAVKTPLRVEERMKSPDVATARATEEEMEKGFERTPGRTPQQDVARTSRKAAEPSTPRVLQQADEAGLLEQHGGVNTPQMTENMQQETEVTTARAQEEQLEHSSMRTPGRPPQEDVAKTPLKTAEASTSEAAQRADEASLQEQRMQIPASSPGGALLEDVSRTPLKTAEETTPSEPLHGDEAAWQEQYVVKTPLKTAEATTSEAAQQANDAGLQQKLEQSSASILGRRSHENVAGTSLMTANATTLRTPLNADDDGPQNQQSGVKNQETDVATARAQEDVEETHLMPAHDRTPTPLPIDDDGPQEEVEQASANAHQMAEKDDYELVTARAQEEVSLTAGLLKPSEAIEERLDTVVFNVISHEKVLDEDVAGTSRKAVDATIQGREAPQDSTVVLQDIQKMQQATTVAKAPASEEESKRSLKGTPQPLKEVLPIKDELETVLFNVVRHKVVLDEEHSRTKERKPQLDVFTARGQEEHWSLSTRRTAQKSVPSKLEPDMVTARAHGERDPKCQGVVQIPLMSDQIKQKTEAASARSQAIVVPRSVPNTPQKTDQVRVETEMFTAPCHGEQLSQSFTRTPQKSDQIKQKSEATSARGQEIVAARSIPNTPQKTDQVRVETEMFTAPCHGEQLSQSFTRTPQKSDQIKQKSEATSARGQEIVAARSIPNTSQKTDQVRVETEMFTAPCHGEQLSQSFTRTPQKSDQIKQKSEATSARGQEIVAARSIPNTPQKTDQVKVETEMFTAPCHGEQLSQSFTRTPQKVEQMTSQTKMFTAPSHREQQSQKALKAPVKSEPVQGIEDRLDTLVFNVIRHVMVLDEDLPKTPAKSADVSRTPQQNKKGVATPAKELDMVTARSRFGEQPSQAGVTTAKKVEEQKALDERLEASIWNVVTHEAVLGENDSIAMKKTSAQLQNASDVEMSTARQDATTQQILANWLELDVVRTTLAEQTDNVISRSLQSEQDTPASHCPTTDQEITTAVAKTSEPKQPAEFSLAKMFPALFGRSAPVEEQGSTADAQSDAAATPPPPLASSRLAPFKLPEQPAKPRNPRQDVTRFRSEYANKFAIGSRHTVDFFSGSYDDAQREARNGVRLIIVFIHDPTLEDSSKLINESLNTVEFGDLVATHNLLVWGVSNDSEEGKYVAYNLHVNKYPFLSLMCPRADNRFYSARRITGFTSPAELVSRLQKSIEIARVDLKDLREQKEKLLADRRLMEEQEKAYKESAERDKQKILEAKRARQEQKEAEEREKRKQTEAEERRKVITAKRELLRQEVLVEPVGKTKDVVRVQVRFPSGQKFTKKFALDDSLEKLFVAIICSEECPIFFTVAAGFPRSPIHCAPEWYHKVLCEQMAADGFAPTTFKQPSSFRAAGLSGAVGVFVNNYGS